MLFHPQADAPKPSKPIPIFNWLAFLPALGVACTAWKNEVSLPDPYFAVVLIVAALTNGITEEKYWRQMFATLFYPNRLFGAAVPWLLFSLWHVALLAIPNIEYEGGALLLLGGAALLGALFGVVYWFNHSFWVVSSAHVLVNVFAFAMLANDNAWPLG